MDKIEDNYHGLLTNHLEKKNVSVLFCVTVHSEYSFTGGVPKEQANQ